MEQPVQKTIPSAAREPKHFGYIDAVRGLAFLGVLTLHAGQVAGPFPFKDLLQGGFGVQLFFLASAITLCNSMASRQKNDRYPIFYFYLRRLFRIGPLFWCGILFYWVVPGVLPPLWYSQWAPTGVHPSYFILTALFLHGWHPYTFNSIVPGGWSIAVEMTFYVIFPFLFIWVNTPRKALAAVLLSILYLKLLAHDNPLDPHSITSLIRDHFYAGVPDAIWNFFAALWFPNQFPVFLVGFFAYFLLKNDHVRAFAKERFWATCLFLFCIMMLITLFRGTTGFIPGTFLVVLTLAGIIIAMSGERLWWLTNPVIRYIGKISYSCYLVHFAAIEITLKLLGIPPSSDSASFDTGHPLSNFLSFIKVFLVALGFTVAMATLTLHLIENPGIALGKKLIQRINSWSGEAGVAAPKAESAN